MELVNSATHTAGFRIDSNNKPYYINSQGGRYKRFAALANPSDWNHWCWIFPSDTSYTDAKLYINGVEQSVDYDYTAAPANTAWNGFYINKFQTSSSATFKMSNLQLWSGNLTEPQITELYNNGSPITTEIASSNLKAWYKLDNNEKFDGTNWSVENQKYPSNYDSCLDFDGSTSEITLNSNSTSSSDTAVSFWMKASSQSGYGQICYGLGSDMAYQYLSTNGSGSDLYVYHGSFYKIVDDAYDGNWNHIVISYNNTTNEVKGYKNGVLDQTVSATWGNQSFIGFIGARNGIRQLNGLLSNFGIFTGTLDQTSVTSLYNNGTPLTDMSSFSYLDGFWELDNLTTGLQDTKGSNDGTNNGATKVNTFVSTQAGISSGMAESNLVNNNVSALNGESSGMTSANLVTSDLTRAIPYGDGYSFNFDSAASDKIDCGDIGFYTPEISFSCWIYPTDNGQFIEYGSSGTNPAFWCFVHSSTDLRIYVRNAYRVFNSCITLNQWHHIAITRTDYNDGKVYVNGISQGDLIGTVADLTQTGNLIIGSSFNGKISNFSVFNEALTSTEVLKLYANGVPQDLSSFTPAPVAWYPLGSNSFWNGSNWTVRDMSASGSNDGTGVNIGADGLVGDAPRSEANGTGTNMDIPSNLIGEGGQNSNNNSWSVNMSSLARVEDVA